MNKLFICFFLLVYSHSIFAQVGLPIQQAIIPKNSLVVNYDFSKSTSFTRGSSTVTNIAGTASGSATLVQSPNFMNSLGYISFNGTNQYLVTPNLRTHFKVLNNSIQKSFTMCAWVYPTKLNGVIVSELDSQTPSGGWHATNIEIVNGIIYYRIWNGTSITSLNSLSLNQWYHLAIVYDGVKLKAYLNGVLQGSQINDRELPTLGQYYTLAASETTHMGSGGVNGGFYCAQFKLFQLPLSDKDIQQEYNLRKDDFDYTIHSPSTNTNPTYWSTSSNFSGDAFYANAPFPTTVNGYHFTPWLNSPQGWSAGTNNSSQNIVLNYDEPAYIKGIVTQPRTDGSQWVTAANIETSLTGAAPWTTVFSSQSLNSNGTSDVSTLFSTPIYARAVRVSPTANGWSGHITMRMGLLVKPNNYITSNLVLHYNPTNLKSYSGTGTTISDLSGNALNGTMSNITFTSPYFIYNGTSSSVSAADNALLEPGTGDFTVEAWVYYSAFGSQRTIVSKTDNGGGAKDWGYGLRTSNIGETYMEVGNGTTTVITPKYTISTGQWYQVVGVWTNVASKSIELFVNGVSRGSNSHSFASIKNTVNQFYLGSYNGGEFSQWMNGRIGVVRIYNKALSASEILVNFNAIKMTYGL